MSTPTLPPIKTLVKGTRVRFLYYRKGELWYEICEDRDGFCGPSIQPTFAFPVPTDDCGDASFLIHDRALLFMRYIRKHLESLQAEIDTVAAQPAPTHTRTEGPIGEIARAIEQGMAERDSDTFLR